MRSSTTTKWRTCRHPGSAIYGAGSICFCCPYGQALLNNPRHNILKIPQTTLQLFGTFPFVRAKEMYVLTEIKYTIVCFLQAFIVSRLIYTGSHRIWTLLRTIIIIRIYNVKTQHFARLSALRVTRNTLIKADGRRLSENILLLLPPSVLYLYIILIIDILQTS